MRCSPCGLGLAGVHRVSLALHECLVDGRRGRADQLVVVDVHEARGVGYQEEVRRPRDPLDAGHPENKTILEFYYAALLHSQ